MRFGAGISNCREGKVYSPGFTTPDNLILIAQAAEKAGFASVWGNDLQTTFDELAAQEGHKPPNFFEIHTTLAFLAAHTERVRLVSGAVTMPLRDPVLLAKQAATLDQLSGGRYVLGLGLGGKRTEMDRVRGRFSSELNRGRYLDEGVELLRRLFHDPVVDFEGEYFSVRGAEVYPKPVQDPMPIYLTGGGDEMLRRAAEFGAGWIHMNVTPEQVAALVGKLRDACDTTGRDWTSLDMCIQFDVAVGRTTQAAQDRWGSSLSRALSVARGRDTPASYLVGSPDDLIRQLQPYREAGVSTIACIVTGRSAEEVVEQIELLGQTVIPALSE